MVKIVTSEQFWFPLGIFDQNDHEEYVDSAIRKLENDGYNILRVERVSKIPWGENRSRIYYE